MLSFAFEATVLKNTFILDNIYLPAAHEEYIQVG